MFNWKWPNLIAFTHPKHSLYYFFFYSMAVVALEEEIHETFLQTRSITALVLLLQMTMVRKEGLGRDRKITLDYHLPSLCPQHHLFPCYHRVKKKGSDNMKCLAVIHHHHLVLSRLYHLSSCSVFIFFTLLPLLISEKKGRHRILASLLSLYLESFS